MVAKIRRRMVLLGCVELIEKRHKGTFGSNVNSLYVDGVWTAQVYAFVKSINVHFGFMYLTAVKFTLNYKHKIINIFFLTKKL